MVYVPGAGSELTISCHTYTYLTGANDVDQSLTLSPDLDTAGPYVDHSTAPGLGLVALLAGHAHRRQRLLA